MDPLRKAVKNKVASRWTQDDEGPVLEVDIKGGGATEHRTAPDGVVFDDDDQEFYDLPPTKESDEGYFEDDEGDEGSDMTLEEARKRFRQGQMDKGEDPEWSDPYNEPDDEEYGKNDAYFKSDPSTLESGAFDPEEVARFEADLSEQGIDLKKVTPSFLKSEFDLTTPEAYWLVSQWRR